MPVGSLFSPGILTLTGLSWEIHALSFSLTLRVYLILCGAAHRVRPKCTCGPKPACACQGAWVYFLYDSAGLSFGLAIAFLSESLIGMPTTLPRGGMGLVNHLA